MWHVEKSKPKQTNKNNVAEQWRARKWHWAYASIAIIYVGECTPHASIQSRSRLLFIDKLDEWLDCHPDWLSPLPEGIAAAILYSQSTGVVFRRADVRAPCRKK